MSNFGWNYPPGVSGNEYEIAGPDYERETDTPCAKQDDTCNGWMVEQGYRGQRWAVCGECNYQVDLPSKEEGRYDTDPRV